MPHVIIIGIGCIFAATAILGPFALRYQSYICHVAPGSMAFVRPFLVRVVNVLLSLLVISPPILITSIGVDTHQDIADNAIGLALLSLICLALGALVLRLAGKNELWLNLEERTYRRVSGWPIFPQTRSGPWTDFWGIYAGYNGNSNYFVGVRGQSFGGRMDLGRFRTRASARQFADEMASVFELPLVTPPKPLSPIPSTKRSA